MEQKEKVEKPGWVEEIEALIPSARQTVGTVASNCIQQLGFLWSVSPSLYNEVIEAVKKEIYEKYGNVDVDAL